MLFERSAVSLFERGKRAKQVEERERVRERERDDDGVVVVVVVVDVKFHSADPERDIHSSQERRTLHNKREEKKRVSKEKRKKKSHAYRRVLIDVLLHFDRPLRVVYSQQKQSKERDPSESKIL